MSKFIFLTGGVISSIGKGTTVASIGSILKSRGYSIFVQKLDPYLNLDPGTMSPNEHGEVFVTEDGGETDLDLGHYERFIETKLTKDSNYTSGQIYNEIFRRERIGYYNGKTVQIIPHVTDYIEEIISNSAQKYQVDFVIVEIGGTIGDIESQPFLYALSIFNNKYKGKCFFAHVSYVPLLNATQEFKSKPAQYSLENLRKYGINPHIIILRSSTKVTDDIITKMAYSSMLKQQSIINLVDVKSIYEIPLLLEKKNVAQQILEYFKLPNHSPQFDDWKQFVQLATNDYHQQYSIAMIGKYNKLKDAYFSIIEALNVASYYQKVKFNLVWLDASSITKNNIQDQLKNFQGALILPGFGKRGFDGKVIAAKYLMKSKIPTFGICYGMQAMVIAWAQEKGFKDAISTENSSQGTPIIDILPNQNGKNIGGTLRLGKNETRIKKDTVVYKIYQKTSIFERHRHRYEINDNYKNSLEKDGFIFSGYNPTNGLSEIIEYNKHPFYIGVQYHPEFNSTPLKEHPLFRHFTRSIINIFGKQLSK